MLEKGGGWTSMRILCSVASQVNGFLYIKTSKHTCVSCCSSLNVIRAQTHVMQSHKIHILSVF